MTSSISDAVRFYTPGPIFADKPVVCVAGGPSLTLKQVRIVAIARNLDLCRVIAINDAMFLCGFADIGFALDARWWAQHNQYPRFGGARVMGHHEGKTGLRLVKRLNITGLTGFDPEPGTVRNGANTGTAAVHLAAQLATRKIFLVAYDFSGAHALDHWFGRYEQPEFNKQSDVQKWLEYFRILTDILAEKGVEVVQCSPRSAIDWLPTAPVETILQAQAG